MATQSKSKISSLYNAISNPSGGSKAFADLINGLQVKGPIFNTPAPNMSTVNGPVYVPPNKSASPVKTPKPAPNMSTPAGPVYAAPPSLSQVASGAPARPAPIAQTPAPVAPPVVPPAPVAQPPRPIFQQPQAPAGAPAGAPATATETPQIPKQWIRADGTIKTPDEVAADIAATVKSVSGAGDIGRLALNDFGNKPKSAEQLRAEASGITNTRNDIATGQIDPYKVASDSGIAYTASELAAIEKAYAGIYDPALNTALAKLEQRQAADAAEGAAKAKAQGDANAPFTLGKDQIRYDGQGNVIATGVSGDGTGVGSATTYVRGANPTVDAYISGLNSGTYKASDIPDEYKSLVAQGMASTKPAISLASTEAVSVINQLLGSGELGRITGFSTLNPIVYRPGAPEAQYRNLAKQLQGMLSLENRNQLKGSGAISDFEFRVLRDASSALGITDSGNSNLSEEDFVAELEKLQLKLLVGETELTDDELMFLNKEKGYTPEEIREFNQTQAFNGVGNTIASTGQGNRPQRNNNPGNVKMGGLADSLAIGQDDQGHLQFPDAATGFKALTLDLTAKINGASRYLPANPTIAQLGKVYAEDPNWPIKVAAMLGVPVSTQTKNIPIEKLAQAIARQEGFYA
jgi:hypothetical protein